MDLNPTFFGLKERMCRISLLKTLADQCEAEGLRSPLHRVTHIPVNQ